jgi:short-subunit dehydrogenase
MGTFAGKVALVTGASSGLGAELARQLGRSGARVGLLALPGTGLDAVAASIRDAGGVAATAEADVGDREGCLRAIARLAEELGPIDVAVLNAGISINLTVREFSSTDLERLLRVNLLGVAHGIEAVLPGMLARGSGQVVGMSSVASYRANAFGCGYSASKVAIAHLLEGLRVELRARRIPIAVTTVRPGLIRTPLTDWIPESAGLMGVERAARIILDGVARRRAEVQFPRGAVWVMALLRLLPVSLFDPLAARFTRRFIARYPDDRVTRDAPPARGGPAGEPS